MQIEDKLLTPCVVAVRLETWPGSKERLGSAGGRAGWKECCRSQSPWEQPSRDLYKGNMAKPEKIHKTQKAKSLQCETLASGN